MNLLLTRPEPDAAKTAARLVDLGHRVLSLPVTEIVATGTPIPEGDATAILATSANALRALHPRDLDRLAASPLHCVGGKTASIARELGFRNVKTAGGSGEKLLAELLSTYAPPASFLYLTGTPRKPGLEKGLSEAGYRVRAVELYEARRIAKWPPVSSAGLNDIHLALHFSRASVEALLELAERSDTLPVVLALRHLCLSEDVAAPLRAAGADRIRSAEAATETALFDEIDQPWP
jgi:uroporphyrinogen-III synthase